MTVQPQTYPDTLLYIDGEWREGAERNWIDVENPATGATVGRVAVATKSDLEEAAQAAAREAKGWAATSALERSSILRRAADLLRQRVEPIAPILVQEQGKPLAQARMEISSAADIIDWFAEEGRRVYGRIIPPRAEGVSQQVIKLPVGPVAAFTPWNFPVGQAVRKISAALSSGCPIVLKAPEETPAAPAELVRAFVDAGVPKGVIALVYGNPAEISEYLIAHPAIQKISFTGSTAVGRLLASLAGTHMKRATMELGGHAPVIVNEDADIDAAIAAVSAAKFRNAGQVCISPTRMMVHQDAFDNFLGSMVIRAKGLRIGNGLEDGVEMGPLANGRRVTAIEALVNDAVEHGAQVVTGGRRYGNSGHFFEPTVLANVPVSARIMNEEPFGPIAIVNSFAKLDDAISEANRLPYGLASYGFTQSAAVAHRFAHELHAGMTSINHFGLALPETPFGGVGDSGYGSEGGLEAMEPYLITKFVSHRSA